MIFKIQKDKGSSFTKLSCSSKFKSSTRFVAGRGKFAKEIAHSLRREQPNIVRQRPKKPNAAVFNGETKRPISLGQITMLLYGSESLGKGLPKQSGNVHPWIGPRQGVKLDATLFMNPISGCTVLSVETCTVRGTGQGNFRITVGYFQLASETEQVPHSIRLTDRKLKPTVGYHLLSLVEPNG